MRLRGFRAAAVSSRARTKHRVQFLLLEKYRLDNTYRQHKAWAINGPPIHYKLSGLHKDNSFPIIHDLMRYDNSPLVNNFNRI